MIDEALLRSAAAKSIEKHVAAVEANLVPMEPHVFSEKFETKIRKLTKRAKHPVLYHAVKRVASIVLAIILTGSVWLVVDVDARAAFVGWVKEAYESMFAYHFEGKKQSSELSQYRLGYVPEGYSVFYENNETESVFIMYKNEANELLKFRYTSNPDETDWMIVSTDLTKEPVVVNGFPGELLISHNPETAGGIFWTDNDNTAFYISAFFIFHYDILIYSLLIQIE